MSFKFLINILNINKGYYIGKHKKNRELLLNDINTCHLNSKFKNSNITKLVAVSKKQDEYKIDLQYR